MTGARELLEALARYRDDRLRFVVPEWSVLTSDGSPFVCYAKRLTAREFADVLGLIGGGKDDPMFWPAVAFTKLEHEDGSPCFNEPPNATLQMFLNATEAKVSARLGLAIYGLGGGADDEEDEPD